MGLLADLFWQAWILPAALVLTWIMLCWRGTQTVRLWFALLSVAGSVVSLLLGAQLRPDVTGPVPLQYGGMGESGDQWGRGMPHTSEMADLLVVNGILALIVAVPLAMVVPVVDAIIAQVKPRRAGRTSGANCRTHGAESGDVRR
ncbi:hypothetical protein [Paractinoplanes maris]|uniref:hypothetical protein n=1 Tax=Paractinoplanes maris TaxID=1734446 RepID=UPI0020208E01|nr:hypothetical protein [Actinoplanes maris]